jgi:hypothetical protein
MDVTSRIVGIVSLAFKQTSINNPIILNQQPIFIGQKFNDINT